MGLQIPITGVAQDFKVPGGYAEILVAQGASTQSAPAREVVFVMPMLSTGTWTAATKYQITSEKDASDGAGPGSPLHRAARFFLKANKTAKLFAVPVAETSGGVPAAATGTITITGPATASGILSVTVCGEDCTVSYKKDDTATTIAANLVTVINGRTWLPLTAGNAAGVVTLTAKLKGISQGTAALGVLRYRATQTSGTGVGSSTSGAHVGTVVAGAEGTTTEAANLATALAVIATTRKYFVVTSANDTTSYTNLKNHVSTKSEPRTGLRSVAVAAYPGTLANTQTLALAQNYERFRLFWQKNSEHDTAEMAAQYAAILQKRESTDATYNFDNYREADWLLLPVYADADRPSLDDQNDAINDGISVVATNDAGSYLVMSCCTRSKNSAGTVDDFRATQTRVISECDSFVDELLINFANNHGNKKFAGDETLADGSVNPNQRQIRGVLRPSQFKTEIAKQMDEHEAAGQLQNVADTKAGIRCVKTGARLEVAFDLEVINWLDQMTARVAEVSAA